MALAVTLLGTATFDTNSGTKTVTATPAVGDLIVIVTAHSGNVSSATPTDNNSSGAYTRITSALAAASVDTLGIHIRTTLIGSAVSTIFSHAPGTSTGGGLAVLKVTGMQKVGSSASRASAKQDNQTTGTTPTPVLAQAALTTNALIGAVLNATNAATLTPRGTPAWTERCDVGYNTPPTGLETMSINSGETGTSIAWGGTSPSAFGSLVLELDANQVLTPGLFTNSAVFSAPTVAATYGLTPGVVTNVAAFFAPAVTSPVTLTPSLFTNSSTFFAPTVGRGAVGLTPSLVTDADTFPAATVSTTYGLTPALLTNSGTFYSAAVAPGAVALLPSLVSDADTFFSPTVGRGSVNLAPSLAANSNSFSAPVVTRGVVGLTPSLVVDSDAFYSPTVSTNGGPAALLPSLIANTNSFPIAAVSSTVGLLPSLLASSAVFPASSLASLYPMSPALLTNVSIFHSPTVEAGTVNVSPPLLSNDNDFHPASIGITSDVELLAELYENVVLFRCAHVRSVIGPYPLLGENPSRPLTAREAYELAGRSPSYPLAGHGRTFP